MAREFNPNRILHGNEGTAWFNGKKLTTLQSIEAKVAGDFEDINVCGDPSTHHVYNGYSGEGTFTCLKMDSDVVAMMAEAFRTGEMPTITIITAPISRTVCARAASGSIRVRRTFCFFTLRTKNSMKNCENRVS